MLDHGLNNTFTDRVKTMLRNTQSEAIRLGNDYAGTEHLLLGLLKDPDGIASLALASLKVNFGDLRSALEKIILSNGMSPNRSVSVPMTPRAKKALEMACNEARAMGHKFICTEHVLLALIKDAESNACKVLMEAGMTYDKIKKEVESMLRGVVDFRHAATSEPEMKIDPTKTRVDWFEVDAYGMHEINPKLKERNCTAADVISITKTEASGYLIFFKNKQV